VIDAGHGGEDGGAVSCTGAKESDINLQIAIRLNDLLRLMGFDTVMIRTTDTAVHTGGSSIAQRKTSDLKNRVRMVNQVPGAVLLSIHQNYFTQSKYSGAQMFYNCHPVSRNMATQLQQAFVSILNPGSNRAAKPAEGVYLMQNITRPGILVECGFLSNPEEEAKLRDKAYQQKLCAILAASVGEFLTK
jgi:N-acetylmuramoyl-L-alanine amidase